MKKQKRTASIVALAMAAVLALTGTFAWQSISQTAKNEAAGTVNPGGRLHDDFNGTHKAVYVENFTTDGAPIYARIRLAEYMEIGEDAGKETTDTKRAESLVAGAKFDDVDTWTTHIPDEQTFSQYWTWSTGGSTVYMPTFNMNKDSLQADINGTYAGINGNHYDDYVPYTEGKTKTADEIWDADDDTEDEKNPEEGVDIKTVADQTHTAKPTIEGTVKTMAEWLEDPVPGDFWVWDTDGWAYWANPIKSQTATAPLLNGIQLKGAMINSWYYGINVVGEFVTAEDLGKKDNTGFYAPTTTAPTANAEKLLETIGVDVSGSKRETEVVAEGTAYTEGTHTITKGVTVTEANKAAVAVSGESTSVTITGGTFDGGEGGNNKCVQVTEGATVTIKDGDFTVGGDAKGEGNSVVYSVGGNVVIEGGFFHTDCAYNGKYYVLNQNNSNPGTITVKGGTFVNYDPSTGDDNLGGNFVADGYKVISEVHGEDTWYTVIPM